MLASMLRPRHSRGRLTRLAFAALAVAITTSGTWIALRPTPLEALTSRLSASELLAALRDQKWPENRPIPESYTNPELLLLDRHRTARPYFLDDWNAQNRATKLELLQQIGEKGSPLCFPFLAEIAYFTLASETDAEMASLLFGAMLANTHAHVEVAIYVCDLVKETAQDQQIRAYAAECSSALLSRRQRLGY